MRKLALFLVVAVVGLLAPARADAHFKLNSFVVGSDTKTPISWMSQDTNGGPQKNGPCAAMPNTTLGDVAGTPTKVVTELQPGAMVNVSVTATIAHPGWYRVALVEGASATHTLTTLPDPMTVAPAKCTPAIMSNPVWSTTQPILADGLPAGSMASTSQSGTKMLPIKIPETATCTTAKPCSLQVIMVMTDHPANDCYYHHCADITLVGAAPADGGAGGMSGGGGADASVPDASSTGSGGASGSGAATATGGVTASGGSPSTGGSSASGGSTSSGGSTGSGGVTASGGSPSSGGSPGSGGSVGSGGNSASSGGSPSTGGSSSSGGCSWAAKSSTDASLGAAVLLLAVVLMARARRRPQGR